MSYHYLTEGATNLLLNHIQTKISAALDSVAAAVGNPVVTLETPVSYFIYPKPQGYKLPAVFVICDTMDFRSKEKQSNFINALDSFDISVVVEDQDLDNLTYKAWRYQTALYAILDQADIVSQDSKLVLNCVIQRADFSPIYTDTDGPNQGGQFRKEIVLRCDVEHLENF